MINPRISVVIPLYNKELSIARAINSIIRQSVQPDEIIIVNDGSVDKSASIVEQFNNPLIKLIHQDNRGVSAARNKGIESATFEYIAFLDADDEWLPNFLSTIKELIGRYPDAVGYGTAYLLKYNDGSTKSINIQRIHFDKNSGIIDNYFEVANHSDPPINASSICIKRKCLNDIKGFPLNVKAGEDLLTWARLAFKGKFAYSLIPSSIYYQRDFNELSLSPATTPSKTDSVGNGLLEIYRQADMKEKTELKKYISRWHKMRATLFLINSNIIQTLKEIFISLRFNCTNLKTMTLLFLIPLPAPRRYNLLFSNRSKNIFYKRDRKYDKRQ